MFSALTPPYDVICADPPWKFASNSRDNPGRNAMRHYPTVRPEVIAAMPVADLAADNAALFLWITGPHLVLGTHLKVMKAWGFKPTAIAFTWVKLKPRASTLMFLEVDLHMGGGFTTRKNCEFCILGKRGKSLRDSKSVHEVIVSARREHSRKPPEFLERVRKYVGPDAKICELFAREQTPGVDAWGNEVDKFGGCR